MAYNMMSNSNYLDTKSYTLFLSSADKVSGTNNNAIFDIKWESFLPKEFTQFKVAYSFVTTGGYYLDVSLNGKQNNYNNCRIVADFNSRSCSYDSALIGPSLTLGYAQRDIQITGSSSNCFSSFFYQFPGKTIFTPTQNSLNIRVYNPGLQVGVVNQLLVNTLVNGTPIGDMTNWNMVLEFVPISQSQQNVLQASAYTK